MLVLLKVKKNSKNFPRSVANVKKRKLKGQVKTALTLKKRRDYIQDKNAEE
jgi:hypothetical protein